MGSAMKLTTFLARYGTDEDCRTHLESVRWPHGPVCDRCGAVDDASPVARRPGVYRCRACGKDFRITVGTPMEDSRLPLRTWYLAMYLILASSKGISSVKLGEQLGITQKSAWFLGHRIGALLDSGEKLPLSGIVEADESYIGGKAKNLRKNAPAPAKGRGTKKPMLFAAAERGGDVRTARTGSAQDRGSRPSALALDWQRSGRSVHGRARYLPLDRP
jgi:transposase-like protein